MQYANMLTINQLLLIMAISYYYCYHFGDVHTV